MIIHIIWQIIYLLCILFIHFIHPTHALQSWSCTVATCAAQSHGTSKYNTSFSGDLQVPYVRWRSCATWLIATERWRLWTRFTLWACTGPMELASERETMSCTRSTSSPGLWVSDFKANTHLFSFSVTLKGRANGFKQVYLQCWATPSTVLPTGRWKGCDKRSTLTLIKWMLR